MEGITAQKSWDEGAPLEDPVLRLSSRPMPHHGSPSRPRWRGAAYEDLGCSFGNPPSGFKEKSSSKLSERCQGTAQAVDTSIDELDMLGCQLPRISSAKVEEVGVTGTTHNVIKGMVSTARAVKKLKFSKTNSGTSTPRPRCSSSNNFLDEHSPLKGKPQSQVKTSQLNAKTETSRPRPRPITRPPPSSSKSPGSSKRQLTIYGQSPLPVVSKSPRSVKDSRSAGRSIQTINKPKPSNFPCPSPTNSLSSTDSSSAKSRGVNTGNQVKKQPSKRVNASATPVASFPMPSPLGKGKVNDQAKRALRPRRHVAYSETSDDESEGASSSALKAQPFPMSTQMLDSIGSSPVIEKRSSARSSGRCRGKKRKDGGSSRSESAFEEENTISSSIDPRLLCPYCDTPLPSCPTQLLKRLLASTKKKSHHEPRPGNPLGRGAPFSVFIAVCQRHRFESEILPEAELNGWPKSIDWDKLRKRVGRMKVSLRAMIDDTHAVEADVSHVRPTTISPREQSIFWREMMADVKQKGSRAASGAIGQFASFEKAQPGYYGELGSAIIHQTLYDLFPPASIDSDLVVPLTVNEFIQRILVPEVGLRLIMEDMNLDESRTEDGIRILRKSTNYGVAMFPADEREEEGSQNPGKTDVADLIVMERARKRRKELEADERDGEHTTVEPGTQRESNVGQVQKARNREKGKEAKSPKPRPRPRPMGGVLGAMYTSTSEEEMSSVSGANDGAAHPRRHQLPRVTSNSKEFIEIETTPRNRKIKRAPSEIVIVSSEDNGSQWDTGRMKRGQKKRIGKAPSRAMHDDPPSPSLGTPAGPQRRGKASPKGDEDTPRPHHILAQPSPGTPPLTKARRKSMARVVSDVSAREDYAWLCSDESHQST